MKLLAAALLASGLMLSTAQAAPLAPVNGIGQSVPQLTTQVAQKKVVKKVVKKNHHRTVKKKVVKKNGRAALSVSPGRIDPLNDAWENSRKPLAGEFKFRGRTVFVVANHFASKGGDEAIHGRNQPPNRTSEVQRVKQSVALKAFTEQIRAIDKGANVILAGDLNDYQFSPALKTLTGDGNLKALIDTLPASERYSYVFEGNSQTLDHIVMSKNITRFSYDVVHINAEFADQASDHDPQIVRARPSTGDANVDKIVFALEDLIDCLKK